MRTIVFRMTQLHQRLDERIRRGADQGVLGPLDLFRLQRLRLRVKDRLRVLTLRMSAGLERIAPQPRVR